MEKKYKERIWKKQISYVEEKNQRLKEYQKD